MKTARDNGVHTSFHHGLSVLGVLAFLAPGAWMAVTLPPQPIAQFLFMASAAAIVTAAGLGLVDVRRPLRPLSYAIAALCLVALMSLAMNRFPLQQAAFDLYGEMPGLMWLAYPAVFLAAAAVSFGRSVRDAVKAVVFAGAALVAIMVIWRWANGFVTTFGSPAYSVPAIAPVAFLALGLARTSREHAKEYRLLSAATAAGLMYAGGGLSAVFMVATGLVLTLTFAPELLGIPDRFTRLARSAGAVSSVLMIAALVMVEFPAVGSLVLPLDALKTGEQTVATRIHLWEAAQRMFVERPVLGWGPAGYRFSAVEYYDPAVYSYIGGAGFDPTAYSAPSPHSLIWEVLTRLGIAGAVGLFVVGTVWIRGIAARVSGEPSAQAALRKALAIGAGAYFVTLLVTPTHFASGLLGVFVAGLAVAPSAGTSSAGEVARPPRAWKLGCIVLALVFVGWGAWRMVGLQAGSIVGSDLAGDTARVERAHAIMPGEPLNERRRLELALYAATTPDELSSARLSVDAAPGYITGYAPNLVNFAAVGLAMNDQMGTADVSWERGLLDRAQLLVPGLPSLAAERLHLAIIESDLEALPGAIEEAQAFGATYPYTADYVTRALALLGE